MAAMNRRLFLADVGRTMLLASAGPAFVAPRRCSLVAGDRDPEPLDFGPHEPLVRLLQETEPPSLLPLLVRRLSEGTKPETLVAAAALANARTFGGEDYEGYHAMFALAPSLAMAASLPPKDAALPVLKVLHRNTARIRQWGGRGREVLRRVGEETAAGPETPQHLLEASHRQDLAAAETTLAPAARRSSGEAFRAIQPLIRDELDVHQVVLAWRAWDLLRLTGPEHAHTMLRVAMRQAIDREKNRIRRGREEPAIRAGLPKVIARHHLEGAKPGERRADDSAISKLADTLFRGSGEDGAGAIAEAVASGLHPGDIGEALSLASTRLLLHDPGTSRDSEGKPRGSVHGASLGVHASDAAHAWRSIVGAMDHQNAIASLLAAGWHTAGQGRHCGKEPIHAPAREAAAKIPESQVLDALAESVCGRDQRMAAALAERAADPEAVITRLLPSFLENDGALHHEKYFATQFEILRGARQAFWSEHLAALARIAASGSGFPSAAVAQARALLAG